MFSKIFIFAIIAVTIQGSFGLTTNDLLDLMEDRKGLGSPDLEEIQRLIEAKVADEIDRKMQTFRKLQQLNLLIKDRLRRLGLTGDDFLADDDMTEADQEAAFLLAPIGLP